LDLNDTVENEQITNYSNGVLQEDINYSYDLANRLWAKGMTNYTNDNTGARLSKADGTINWTYQYDGESRLVKALNNGIMVTENTYDGSGMWVKKIADGKTVYFVYNGNESLIEYSAIDSKYTYFIYAGKQAVAEESGGVIKFYHKDHLGSTRVVTDTSGAKIAEYIYEPFGKVIAGTDGEQSFTGKKEDSTGLIYFGARFYDPEVGRFITADTYTNLPNDERIFIRSLNCDDDQKEQIQYRILSKGFFNPQQYNKYAYCGNNPLNKADPDGHFVIAAPVVIVVALAIVTVAIIYELQENGRKTDNYYKNRNKNTNDSTYNADDSSGSGDPNPTRNPAQDKKLSPGEIKKLDKQVKEDGYDSIEDLKGDKHAGSKDLYKDKEGNIYTKPKGGDGSGEYTGYNTNDL
jgi:RHS repeat-associated protein